MNDVRGEACRILTAVEKGEKSGALTRQYLDAHPELDERDKRLLVRLVSGTLEKQLLLDAAIDRKAAKPVASQRPFIRALLRMSVYQILFLDQIPDRAAVSEAVRLAERRGFRNLKGFVNGVLRAVAREPELPEGDAALRHSLPRPLYRRFVREMGAEKTERMLSVFGEERPLTVRRLRSRVSEEELLQSFAADGVTAKPAQGLTGLYRLEGVKSVPALAAFREGLIQVQGLGSAAAVQALAPEKGRVLDLCAAPGGKSIAAADLLAEAGTVTACDLPGRLGKIEENVKRTGLTNIRTLARDATVFVPEEEGRYDLVIADLPCSGLGTIGHKPEIRYRVTDETIAELAALQRQILANAWQYVRPGGRLLYSTCTLTREENEENYQWLTEEFPLKPVDLTGALGELAGEASMKEGMLRLIPGTHPVYDGFFLSVAEKTKE